MEEAISEAAEHITRFEKRLYERAQFLRANGKSNTQFLESPLIKPLTPATINELVCAIDSGCIPYSTHGVDMLLIRAVSVAFAYRDSKLTQCEYHPMRHARVKLEVKNALDDHEKMTWGSLVRLNYEISLALESIGRFSPALVLIDGSLLPLAGDRPTKESELSALYNSVISRYKELYAQCTQKNILLAGIIKDTRSKRFMECVRDQIDEPCNDSVFLHHFLNEKERTAVVSYAGDENVTPIMRDLDFPKIGVFYMKSTKNDRPLRVEFLHNKINSDASYPDGLDFDKIASRIHSLSAIHESYAYPAALIEADLCAMLDEKDLERVQSALFYLRKTSALPLRRNARPFR